MQVRLGSGAKVIRHLVDDDDGQLVVVGHAAEVVRMQPESLGASGGIRALEFESTHGSDRIDEQQTNLARVE